MSDAYISPQTQGYVLLDGALATDPADGLANAVYLRLMTPLGAYWHAPDMGSRLHELQREKDVPRVRRLAEDYARQALQPLLDDGRVDALEVTTQSQPGRLAMLVELTVSGGVARRFELHIKVA